VSASKRAAQQRKECTIGGSERGPLDLAAQHLKLVAQDGDLDVLGVLAAEASGQHADQPACHEVEEGQGHRPIVPDPDHRCSAHAARFLNPTGHDAASRQELTSHIPSGGDRADYSQPRSRALMRASVRFLTPILAYRSRSSLNMARSE
jgi:hypothetical protein